MLKRSFKFATLKPYEFIGIQNEQADKNIRRSRVINDLLVIFIYLVQSCQ
jgi:hypothetical protein